MKILKVLAEERLEDGRMIYTVLCRKSVFGLWRQVTRDVLVSLRSDTYAQWLDTGVPLTHDSDILGKGELNMLACQARVFEARTIRLKAAGIQ